MVKSYDRYEQEKAFGVITSLLNIVWIPSEVNAKLRGLALTSALEEILVWDIKTGEIITRLRDGLTPGASNAPTLTAPSPVLFLAHHTHTNIVAAGHLDGSIKVWDLTSASVVINFTGHKSAVQILKFDNSGTRLVSGSADSSIIMWDLVGEEGLFKLKGHKGPITGLSFFSESQSSETTDDMDDYLMSVSKDGLIKLWELKSQQCVETHVAHSNECWSLGVNESKDMALTSGNRDQVKVWRVDLSMPDTQKISSMGVFEKQSKARCTDILFTTLKTGLDHAQVFYLQNADRSIEIWRIRGEDEIKKGVARRTKRLKEKGYEEDEIAAQLLESEMAILITPLSTVRTQAKVRACTWITHDPRKLDVLISLTNNSIQVHSIPIPENIKKALPADVHSITLYLIERLGHRTDIRGMDLSSDNKLLATALNGELKIWNVHSNNVIRSFILDSGYALCCKFLPGGALVVVGFKNGDLELYDLTTSSLVDRVERAHDSSPGLLLTTNDRDDGLAIWSLDLTPDGQTLITGGNDKSVKFWNFSVQRELVPGTNTTFSRMRLVHKQTLDLGEDVLCVRVLPDAKYLAVSLLNNNVQVVFLDSLKLFLTLYGHKLPVLSIDISTDSKLVITSSADKNIKIWGLDFGDCHKSLFGHQDSIMNVRFIPESHNFFSLGKDGLIKYWDGDKFECIQKLAAHHLEVWCLAVSSDGTMMVSASHDHLVRVWVESDDQVFLEEEREKEMDQLYEETLLESLEDEAKPVDDEDLGDTVEAAGKQTMETLKAGEKLIEALDLGIEDVEATERYNIHRVEFEASRTTVRPIVPSRNALLMAFNMNGPEYVMSVVAKIKQAHMDDALLVLPFTYVMRLLRMIREWTREETRGQYAMHISLICKMVFFIVRTHTKELITQREPAIKKQLEEVRQQLRDALTKLTKRIGTNTQGLIFARRQWRLEHETEYVDGETLEIRSNGPKRSFVTI